MKKPIVIADNGVLEERTRSESLLAPFSFREHFVGILSANYTVATNAGGASVTGGADALEGQFGAVRLRCGANAAGGALISTGLNNYRPSNLYGFRYIFGAALPVLSNGTNRFTIRAGVKITPTTFGDATGFYVRQVDNVNGGNFQGVIRNGATETTIDLGFVPVANTPFNIGFQIAPDYLSISFFSIDINGNQVVRGSSALSGGSVPATGTLMGGAFSIQKAVGGGTIDALLDFIQYEVF